MTDTVHGFAELVRELGLVLLGLLLAAVPLALWLAWSPAVYYGVFTVCFVAAGLYILLSRTGAAERVPPGARVEAPARLSEAFIEELHQQTPLTFHHRRLGDQRIRNKLARLRALMRISDD